MTMAGQGSDVLPASRDVAIAAARASSDKQADDIVILDVHELIVITDFFVICSAGTQRQAKTVIESIEDRVRERSAYVRPGARAKPARGGGSSTTSTSSCTCSEPKNAPTTISNGSGATPRAWAGRTDPRQHPPGRLPCFGPIAQLVERMAGSHEVGGSSPPGSTPGSVRPLEPRFLSHT